MIEREVRIDANTILFQELFSGVVKVFQDKTILKFELRMPTLAIIFE